MDLQGINTSPSQPVVVVVNMTVTIGDRSVQYGAQLMVFSHKVEDLRRGMDTAWESMRNHIAESDDITPANDDD